MCALVIGFCFRHKQLYKKTGTSRERRQLESARILSGKSVQINYKRFVNPIHAVLLAG